MPTYKEIEEFNRAINDNNIELLKEMIESHPLRYFFNLKLDKKEFTLFHKIIIYDQITMFNSLLEIFKNKFQEEKGIEVTKHKNSINSNVISQNEEEKKSTDSEEMDDIKFSKLLSLEDKEGNTPILFAAYKGQLNIITKM